MVFEEVLLLPKPCSTRNAPRRSVGRSPRGRCTTPESLSPAEGKVTGCSVIGVGSVIGSRLYSNDAAMKDGWRDANRATPLRHVLVACPFRLAEAELAPARIGLLDVGVVRPDRRREARAAV